MSPPSRIHCAPGTFRSFSPLRKRIVPSATRSTTSGSFTVKRLEISTPGIEPVEQPGRRVVVDVAADHVPDAGDPEERGRVEDVGADDLRHRQRIDEHHHEAEERAAADRGEPDDEAERRRRSSTAMHLVAPAQDERRVARLHAALDERLREEAEPADDERGADRIGSRSSARRRRSGA